jgi:type IV secretion system protein VirD4
MISRQETARPLLTPGEVMQLPPADELVLVAGCPPVRAKKARYFEDARLKRRVLAAPANESEAPVRSGDAWSAIAPIPSPAAPRSNPAHAEPEGDGGLRWEPEPEAPDLALPETQLPAPAGPDLEPILEDEADDMAALQARFRRVARQAALDPDDGLGL